MPPFRSSGTNWNSINSAIPYPSLCRCTLGDLSTCAAPLPMLLTLNYGTCFRPLSACPSIWFESFSVVCSWYNLVDTRNKFPNRPKSKDHHLKETMIRVLFFLMVSVTIWVFNFQYLYSVDFGIICHAYHFTLSFIYVFFFKLCFSNYHFSFVLKLNCKVEFILFIAFLI